MTQKLLSLLLALGLAYWRPWAQRVMVWEQIGRYADWLERQLNTGQSRHGMLAWSLAVLPLAGLAWLGHEMASMAGWVAGLAWNTAVLYLVLDYFTVLARHQQLAAQVADEPDAAARLLAADSATNLAGNLAANSAGLDVAMLVRLAIEQLFLAAERHLLGMILWFMLFGAMGPLVYAVALKVAERWGRQPDHRQFAAPALQIAAWLEGVSARVAAVSFAIVGDFEDALYCWRTQARSWSNHAEGIVLASAAGALGIKLGEPLVFSDRTEYRAELGIHDPAEVADLRSAAGLVWRALAMWLAVLLLMSLARWTG